MADPGSTTDHVMRLELMLDHVPTLISYVDRDVRYRYVNTAYEQWFGHTRDEIIGRHLVDVLGEDAFKRIRPHVERALSGEMVHFEAQIPYKDAGTRHVDATYTPDVRNNGDVAGFTVCVSDITRRKQAEEALTEARDSLELRVADRTRELEASRAEATRYAALSPDIMATANLHGYFTTVNPAFTRILGWTAEELTTRPYAEFIHPDDLDATRTEADRLASGERVLGFHNRYRKKGGEHVIIEWNATVDEERGLIYAVGRDATERLAFEAEVRRNAVARPLVRRLLLSQGGVTAGKRRDLGTRLAMDVATADVDELLDAYEATGGGHLALAHHTGRRYVFHGRKMLELQAGSPRPTCHLALGYVEGVVEHATGLGSLGSEIRCESQGHAFCEFVVIARDP